MHLSVTLIFVLQLVVVIRKIMLLTNVLLKN